MNAERKTDRISSQERLTDNPLGNLDLSSLNLKITDYYDKIKGLYDTYDNNILVFGTGTGKTVGLPPMILKHDPKAWIAITEPRNAPMDKTAGYTAKITGQKVGDLIGVRYKGSGKEWDDKKSQIMYLMEQRLLNEYEENHLLPKRNVIIVDEIHEGGPYTDIIIPLLLEVQAERKRLKKEPLKIIAATATLAAEALREKLGKDTTGLLDIPGLKSFDIDKKYLKRDNPIPVKDMQKEAALLAKTIITDPNENKGDLLIFLPGLGEIEQTILELKKLGINEDSFVFQKLYSGTSDEEKEAISQESTGKRKITFSTNSGETGTTFPKSLFHVIDTGLIKQTKVDPETGMTYLATVPHSWSGCIQRDGRVGRQGPGKAWHLYTEPDLNERERENKFTQPEIQRTNLAPHFLNLLKMGRTNVRQFPFLNTPPPLHVDRAMESLKRLGAINGNEELTEIGREMTKKNTELHLARMKIEGEHLNIAPVIDTLADLIDAAPRLIRLTNKDAYFRKQGSDFLTLLNIYAEYKKQPDKKAWAVRNLIDYDTMENIISEHKNFDGTGIDSEEQLELIGKCIAAGYKDQILELKDPALYKFLANPNSTGIKIDPYSAAANSGKMFLSIASIRKDKSSQTLAQLCHGIKKEWIEDILEKESKPKIRELETQIRAPKIISKPVEKHSDVPVKTSPGEFPSKPVAKALIKEKTSFSQRIKSYINRFINFIKKLFRRP